MFAVDAVVVDYDLDMRRSGSSLVELEVWLVVSEICADVEGHSPVPEGLAPDNGCSRNGSLMQINERPPPLRHH
jgi:hypothetical protein